MRVTGWSRDNARRWLREAVGPRLVRATGNRGRNYSGDTIKVLQRLRVLSGCQCGKYLAVSMRLVLDGMERYQELIVGVWGYSAVVCAVLLWMSAATINWYLKPVRDSMRLRGKTTTKPPCCCLTQY